MPAQPFAPKSFCAFAASLNEQWPNDEAAVRTTMSRAYYGALIEARDAHGLSTEGPGGHLNVIEFYRNAGTQQGSVISRSLSDLRLRRKKADYEPNNPCTALEAYQMIQQAKKVLIALGLDAEPERPKLVPKQEPPVQAGNADQAA